MSGDTKEREIGETGQDVPDAALVLKVEPISEQPHNHDFCNLELQTLEGNKPAPSDNGNPPSMTQIETAPANVQVTMKLVSTSNQDNPPLTPSDNDQALVKQDTRGPTVVKAETDEVADLKTVDDHDTTASASHQGTAEPTADAKSEAIQAPETKVDGVAHSVPITNKDDPKLEPEPATPCPASSHIETKIENGRVLHNGETKAYLPKSTNNGNLNSKHSFLLDGSEIADGSESGTEEDQSAFMRELENFFRERSMEFKPPKFYGEGLNCLKLWRAVTRLGGYDKVTSCKLWRQVGESFKPPKTCTTVSWTFRGFYEKALLDYERHTTCGGEISIPMPSHSEPMSVDNQASGSGRARRDAAARAMQGWHSQRLLGNGEVSDPIIKDKASLSAQKREKQLKSLGVLKRKKPPFMELAIESAHTKASKPQMDTAVVDIGAPADWVKINVQRTKDCFEVYALVPGLLRDEVRVQSDAAGRLVISGDPEDPDNPWGVTAFKKVISLPARIDPHHTSAVVTLHGQLFVRVPFEQSD
ncbi:HSP20 domain-containing protein/ARID domain-containing protein [Cephalotus follicularis]|uniref:HSP20 domain-containing protein/ARID domain-containing protein n=1 Tax=Cephalotus follicularis TaxID=3775 RepID=A0A1Q3CYX6_CEPFO|nr:HSP20 domain-containing protein/ARID domain-containing protein [Cephalotus follicularis]